MKFVHPEFLWALSLLSVPIIIHLFSFRKYKTLYFSSLLFVQHLEQQNKSTQKLKNLLLLFCRLLLITCVVIAFAQPYFPKKSTSLAPTNPVLCIHIDNSQSMSMKGVEGELLSEAKEAAKQLINKASLNTKILLSSNSLDGVEARICTKIQALERLDYIKLSPIVRSYDEVIKWQKNNLKNHIQLDNFSKTQFVYLSDFQKNTNHFNELTNDSVAFYYPIKLVSQTTENLSIDSVWFNTPLHKVGNNNELFIKITNHGEVDLQNIPIHFQTEDLKRDLFVDVPKNNSTITSLSFAPQKTGVHSGQVSIADKHFFSDDVYYFSYKVAEKSTVLIVNGSDANKNISSIYRLDNFYTVNEVEQGSFMQSLLQGTNLVILNGINEISSGLSSNLLEYSNNGGTVAMFPGKKIDYSSINAFLLQLKLPTFTKEIAQTSRINTLNYKDPFFHGVFDKEKENLSLPGVSKYYLTNENSTHNAVNVIQLQNGKTLFYRTNQPKQTFLFTSVLSSDYGSFTTDILYTTLFLRIGELSLLNAPLSVTIGETFNYPLYEKISNDQPIYIANEKVEFIPEKRISGAVTYLDLSGTTASSTLQSGIYSINNQEIELGKIAINYSRKESKTDTWTDSEIKNALKEQGISNIKTIKIDQGISSIELNIDKPYPYWKIFVILAILFFLIEILIIKFWKYKTLSK